MIDRYASLAARLGISRKEAKTKLLIAEHIVETKYTLVMDGYRVLDILGQTTCRPYYPGDMCGGCDECLMAQASFYGCTLRSETLWWAFYAFAYFSMTSLISWLQKPFRNKDF